MSVGATSAADGLRLEVVSGKASGFTINVDERLVIGRHSEGPGRLADDPELSRHHAQISREDSGSYAIEDLASTNGTIVNGSRISSPTRLAVGDSIEVGATTIRVTGAPSAEPVQAPTPQPVDARAATVTVDTPEEMRTGGSPPPEPPAPDPFAPPEPEPVEASSESGAPAPEPVAAVPVEPPPTEQAFTGDGPPTTLEPVDEPPPAPESDSAVDIPELSLHLKIDIGKRAAEIQLEDFEPLRLEYVDGRWEPQE